VFVSCIKFNETKTTPIVDEFYCEQEIGSGYGSENYVESVLLSRLAEIQEDDSENDSKVNEGQEAQNSRDKKSRTVETPRRSERSQRERKQPDWLSYSSIAEFAYSAVVGSPLTFDEAVESSDRKKWRVSMDEQIDAHHRNKTWKLVSRPIAEPVIDNKWVYRIKTDGAGNAVRFKSRLVVRGFRQRKGVDYNNTFSSIARYESARLLLAIAAAKNFELWQFDVSTAFLSGNINETIYMEQPEGYVDSKHPEYVCQLQRAIYGLKQGPVQFNKKISGNLENIGLTTHSDRCVFTGRVGDDIVYIALYVDDAIMASPSKRAIESVTAELSKTFDLKVGEATIFVGIEIYRKKGTGAIKLSQASYVRKLLETFDMSNAKPVSTPMAVGVQLPKLDVQPEVKFPYRETVGSLLFAAMVTRPDIANAVS